MNQRIAPELLANHPAVSATDHRASLPIHRFEKFATGQWILPL